MKILTKQKSERPNQKLKLVVVFSLLVSLAILVAYYFWGIPDSSKYACIKLKAGSYRIVNYTHRKDSGVKVLAPNGVYWLSNSLTKHHGINDLRSRLSISNDLLIWVDSVNPPEMVRGIESGALRIGPEFGALLEAKNRSALVLLSSLFLIISIAAIINTDRLAV